MFKYVIVWKRMNFIGSWIWMIGHQWVTLFKRIKCGQYEEGVTGEWDGGFYKAITAPVSLSLLYADQDVEFSVPITMPCMAVCDHTCHDDDQLNLWN